MSRRLRWGLAALLVVVACGFFVVPQSAEVKKYSSDAYSGYAIPPNQACNNLSPIVYIQDFDAGKGQTSKPIEIRGQLFLQSDTINNNTVVLECPNGNALPVLGHESFTPALPPGSGSAPDCTAEWDVVTFLTTGTFAGAVPDGWCELVITAGTNTWHFPNAWRKDTVPPTLAVQGALKTGRADGTPGGRGLVHFLVDEANNGFSDPDGTCNTSACNQTSNFFGAEVYYHLEGTAWGSKSGTTSGGMTEFEGPTASLVATNRNDPAVPRACYALRLLDTAANLSGFGDPNGFDGVPGGGDDVTVANSAKPRCFVPDGKSPQVTKVEAYFDSTLLAQNMLPMASDGAWVVNKNEDEAPLAHRDKIVYLKIHVSEPLFDPVSGGGNRFGSPAAMADGLDGDNDGSIDEEVLNNADDDADGVADEDLRLTGCSVTAAVAGDKIDNDCDGYIDEDSTGGTDTGTGVLCGSKEKMLYTQDATCVPTPQISIQGADPNGTLFSQSISLYSTPSAFRSLSETVYVFPYNVGNISSEDDYTITISMADGVGNAVINAVPLSGGVIRVDNTPPTYKVKYYKDTVLLSELSKTGSPLLPLAGQSTVTIKIDAYDPNNNIPEDVRVPLVAVNQPGTTDITNQTASALAGTSTTVFSTSYVVNAATGGSYIDGIASVTLKGKDLGGNWTGGGAGVYIAPSEGDQFRIDTSPPSLATISLQAPLDKAVVLNDSNGKPTSQPVLRWNNTDPDATSYKVEIAKNSTYTSSAIVRQTSVLLTNYPVGLLADNQKDGPVCAVQADCDAAYGPDSGFECEPSVGKCREYYYWHLAPMDVAGNTASFTSPSYRFRVDAQPPQMAVELYNNYATGVFTNPLTMTSQGYPVAIAGTVYIRLSASEALGSLPTFSINQVGETDALGQLATETAPGSGVYYGQYIVQPDNGLGFQDGLANITFSALDTSGNEATNATPNTGSQFLIDTKPPEISALTANPSVAGNVTVSLSMVVSEQIQTPVSANITGDCLGGAGTAPFTYVNATAFQYLASYNVTAADTTCTATVTVTVTDFANQVATRQATFQVDTLDPDSPELDLPQDNTDVNVSPSKILTPLFVWGSVSDAVSYHMELATAQTFTSGSILIDEEGLTDTQIFAPNPLPNPNGDYFWRVRAVDLAGNKTQNPQVFKYTTDNTPPAAPTFNASVPATTKSASVTISGTAEGKSMVKLYRNGQVVQVLTPEGAKDSIRATDAGAFTFTFDNDGDGPKDEDPFDGLDNDEDGQTDEDPPDYPLLPGINQLTARATDRAGNEGPLSAIKDISLDTGPPKFNVSFYKGDPAIAGQTLVPTGADGLPQVGVGQVWFKFTANEDLKDDLCVFSVNQPGTSDSLGQACTLISPANKREFKGSYTVSAANGGTFVDGQATLTLTATDLDGNTATDTVPEVGRAFRIDTSGAAFEVEYFREGGLNERLPRDASLNYIARQGPVYVKVIASEGLKSGATLTVNQPGTADDTVAISPITGSQTIFKALYNVQAADGGLYVDGLASLTFSGEDLAGNTFTSVVPLTGPAFALDTTPPTPPILGLPATQTNFSNMTLAVTGEPYGTAVIRHSRKMPDLVVTPGDTDDNDDDLRTDEEPGGVNGLDDDLDGFIDEDVSNTPCALGQYLSGSVCVAATQDNRLIFSQLLDENGQAAVEVTTLANGLNLLTAYQIDLAGNASTGAAAATVTGTGIEIIALQHSFPKAGWQPVSIPLFNPVAPKPKTGFQMNTDFVSVEQPPLNQGGVQDPLTLYRVDSKVASMLPGVGYWVYLPVAPTTVTLTGQKSKVSVLNLKKGWNLIGPPYNQTIAWNSNVKVAKTGSSTEVYPLDSAEAENMIHTSLYIYDPQTKEYTAIAPGAGDFLPFIGYFLLAKEDCQLVLPDAP